MSEDTNFDISTLDGVTVVRLGPEYSSLYEGVLSELKPLTTLAETVIPPRLILDLSHTKFFGSAFIGFLMTLSNRLRARDGGRFAISGLASFGRMALEKTGTTAILELFDDASAAIEALSDR